MSGSISPAMLIAAGGFLQGKGLGVSKSLTDTLSSFTSSPLTTSYTNLISSLNGAAVPLPEMPSYLTGLDGSGNSIATKISTVASQIAPDTKKFISNFNGASAFGSASFAWSAAITAASSKGFGDFGGGMSKFSDMASGGLSQMMSPAGIKMPGLPGAEGLTLPGLPNAPGLSALQVVAKPDFAALGSTFKNFGKAFDTSDVKNMFSPAGFFKNLQKQGLDNVGGISDQMIDMGMDPNVPEAANPDDLKAILATVVGTDLQKIITQTGIVLPPTASVNSAADLLDAKKILPSDILSKLPGGSLAGLGNSLLNMGGTFKSPADLGKMLSSVKTIELPHMDALSSPLPDDIKSAFAPMLGKGGGPFGNPTVNDIVGTAAGHAHTDAIGGVVTSQASILASPAGQALKAAVDALAADPTSSVKMATFLAAQSAVTNSTNADLAKVVKSSEDAITATEDQLDTETSNLSVAGITPTAAVTPPPTQLLGTASKLHDMGVDKQELGYNDMLTNMSDDDLYGDAIKATLSEGKNIAASAAAGIPNTTKIDPQAVLAQVKGQV